MMGWTGNACGPCCFDKSIYVVFVVTRTNLAGVCNLSYFKIDLPGVALAHAEEKLFRPRTKRLYVQKTHGSRPALPLR